jgi:hypothetical protein
MKRVIFSTLLVACASATGQTVDNQETLRRIWQVVHQIDSPNMETASEYWLAVRIELPVAPTMPPSPFMMETRSGRTTWLFTKSNLESLKTNISGVRYERMHNYIDNMMSYRLGIGMDKVNSCISSDEVREFLGRNKYPENALLYGGLSRPTNSIHNDYEEKKRRGNGIYTVGVRHSRINNKPLEIWFSFEYHLCLQGVTAIQF